jgi:DnaJ-class molecular chaperone
MEDLTSRAKELQKRYDDIKHCVVCEGRGTTYEQPYGVEQICFSCHGTGKKKSSLT